MPHRNAHGNLVPDHLWEVAERVHRLVQRDGVLDRWRGQIAEWLERQVVSPTLDEHGYLRLSERPAGEYSPLDFELRMDEKYAVLGAIHDLAASSGTVLIGPHDRPDEVTAGACAYLVLRVTVAEYSQTEAAYLLRFLADFQADLGDLVGHNDAEVEALADVEAMAQHERRLRDLVATYNADKARPAVADKGIGHILHVGHTCEYLLVELLRDLFTWKHEKRLNESAVSERFQQLAAASEEADGLTKNEGKVLALTAGCVFSLCGQQRHWQSGHECLFDMVRTMAADFVDGAQVRALLEGHVWWRAVADWPKLLAQVQRERSLAESATEISLQPLALIKEVQGAQQGGPYPLKGTMPEGSPEQRKHKARQQRAKKGAETKAAQKEEKAIRVTDAINAAKIPPPPSVEARLAWKIMHEVTGRTQEETAGILSFCCGSLLVGFPGGGLV